MLISYTSSLATAEFCDQFIQPAAFEMICKDLTKWESGSKMI